MNPPLATDCTAAAAALADFYATLTPASLSRLGQHYAPDARFKDPFNDVQGLAAIRAVFEHMFARLEAPRFVITQQVVQGNQCFMVWEFFFGLRGSRGAPLCIRGATQLVFSADALVLLHRDYWDAAEELYEKLPGLGALMRWLKRRARS